MTRAALPVGLALTLALALAACGKEAPAPEPRPKPTVAAPRTLVAADLDFAKLGAKIEGPQGTEVASALSTGTREIGRIVSYVACPEGAVTCVPGAMPAGTVYTYVHQVTLAEADANAEPSDAATPAATTGPAEVPAILFRTLRPATGFTASVGYASSEAAAALGDPDAITITVDRDHLIWRVTGGQGWKPGATITLWWQSTVAPSGPEKAYRLEVGEDQATASAPFPADTPVDPARAAR